MEPEMLYSSSLADDQQRSKAVLASAPDSIYIYGGSKALKGRLYLKDRRYTLSDS